MKHYEVNDMVKVGCHDCAGCSSCCQGMGDTVVLDPFDVYSLTGNLHRSPEELLEDCVALHVEDGLILPHIQMTGEKAECFFLDGEGRCSVHAFRPGLCRAFPLGRNYEEGRLTYFLLEEGCPAENRTKMKVGRWIGIPSQKQYAEFLITWHYFLKRLREKAKKLGMGEEAMTKGGEELKALNLAVLQLFFLRPYQAESDFYSQFKDRMKEWEEQYGYHGDGIMPPA